MSRKRGLEVSPELYLSLTLCCAIMQISVIYVRNFQIIIILLIFNELILFFQC